MSTEYTPTTGEVADLYALMYVTPERSYGEGIASFYGWLHSLADGKKLLTNTDLDGMFEALQEVGAEVIELRSKLASARADTLNDLAEYYETSQYFKGGYIRSSDLASLARDWASAETSQDFPDCPSHREVQHRDGKPPWCNTCGWTHGRPAVPALKISDL